MILQHCGTLRAQSCIQEESSTAYVVGPIITEINTNKEEFWLESEEFSKIVS